MMNVNVSYFMKSINFYFQEKESENAQTKDKMEDLKNKLKVAKQTKKVNVMKFIFEKNLSGV